MNLIKSIFLLAILGVTPVQAGSLDYPSIWECDSSKFNWYCDVDEKESTIQPVIETPAPKAKPAEVAKPGVKRIEIQDIKTAEEMRQELKRREDLAVMLPSESNIKEYLELWQLAQEKGAIFADTWRRVVWQNPELDYAQKRPANNAAIKVYDENRDQREMQQLADLAKEHGLIFFFRSDCPYCHQMAPTLKMLEQKYGIEVLGVSIDGRGIPDFPSPADGRASAAAWGVERVPALFIGSKKDGDHAAIGFGMMALSEIVNRIFVLTGSEPGENF